MTSIIEETSPAADWRVGRRIVGLEAVQLTDANKLYRGVILYADPDNSSIIYVGNREALQTAGPLAGFPIRPGANVTLPIDNASFVWAISNDTDQVLHWSTI